MIFRQLLILIISMLNVIALHELIRLFIIEGV